MTSQAFAGRVAVSTRVRFLWPAALAAVVVVALALRLYGISRPADYDEGVYWQSLRAMSAGYVLYRDIYYSQPPLFLGLAYPVYAMLGASLSAARLAMIVASMAGLYGIFALGKELAGRAGALAALVLLTVNVPYLSQSQSLHAEIPATALAISGVALSFRRGSANAAFAGLLIAAALLCKLLVIAAVVPFAVLVLMRRRTLRESAWFVGAFAVTIGLVAALFARDMPALLGQVYAFHTAAARVYHADQGANLRLIGGALKTPLLAAAVSGLIATFVRRDAHGAALLAWLLATILSLYFVTPLWDHHLLVVFPPLIALSVCGLVLPQGEPARITTILRNVTAAIMIAEVVSGVVHLRDYYAQSAAVADAAYSQDKTIAAGLSGALGPGEFVITDLQNVAAQAGRSTPPWLVDTSEVRVRSREITSATLITQAATWHVRAVLLGSGRLTLPQLSTFRAWVRSHYRLIARYGPGRELWLR